MNGYLVIRAGGDLYGLPIENVVEVVDGAGTEPIPGVQRAVRGVTKIRGRTMPVVHLAALLGAGDVPSNRTNTVVVARYGARRIAFEVDDADAVVRDPSIPAPPGGELPWVTGVARYDERLIPILDMELLSERLAAPTEEAIQ